MLGEKGVRMRQRSITATAAPLVLVLLLAAVLPVYAQKGQKKQKAQEETVAKELPAPRRR